MLTTDRLTVELIDSAGSDLSIARAARVSTIAELSKESDDPKADAGLINFLAKNRHGTPFEHAFVTFYVKAPIMVFREFHRHRIGWSYNEMSGRYKELPGEFYTPPEDRPLTQSGKPGHYQFSITDEQAYLHEKKLESDLRAFEVAWREYTLQLEIGIPRESARSVLPVATYSQMYASCNPRSLMAFLSLRTKEEQAAYPSFPQWEIEQIARGLELHFSRLFPTTYEAFCKHGRVAP